MERTNDSLEARISSALAREVELVPRGPGETQIRVPFYFDDGDGLVIYLRTTGDDAWQLTDRAHTLQHMSYYTDVDRLRSGTRGELFERVRARHQIDDRDGELVREGSGDADVAVAVFAFVQALLELSHLRVLDREIVRSTFREDLDEMMTAKFPHATVNYIDAHRDPEARYPIPYLLNEVSRPVAVFGVPTDEAALVAVVTAKQHAIWGRRLRLVAIEEDQEKLSRRNVAWLSDAFDKQFSSLHGNEETIVEYLAEEHDTSRRLDIAESA